MSEYPKLTERQRQCLLFIVAHFREHLRSPSLREIGAHMVIRSTNGVNDHLKALIRKGYIVRDDKLSRAIRPIGLRIVYEPPPGAESEVFGEADDYTPPNPPPFNAEPNPLVGVDQNDVIQFGT